MKKKVLSEIDLYAEEVKIPCGFKIDRKLILSRILYNCFIERKSFDSRNTFEVTHSKEMGWFSEYISEHMYLRHGLDLEHYKHYSLILYPGEKSAIRNEHTLSPLSNYTAIYGVDVPKNSTEFILNFKDKNKLKTHREEIYDNKFVLFPSNENYFLAKNTSSHLICFLICNYKRP